MLEDNIPLAINSFEERDLNDNIFLQEGVSSPIDYTTQLNDISSIGVSLLFALGILSGLITGKILWDKVVLWK